ncbi:MAG: hypothetical protein GXX96_33080 [Planctomycetaceae bacterium]|nr:hypothetical protein [Planctomycetaceae bacterium]
MPRGCRLVSFEVLSRKSAPTLPGSRVDVVWSYATSENESETVVLFRDLEILALESPASAKADRQVRRGTVAVTPQQANRLQLAAACGRLGIVDATEHSPRPGESRTIWDIQAIEDRTEGIEVQLASATADAMRLERPTLAAPPRISANGVRRVITVPVEP